MTASPPLPRQSPAPADVPATDRPGQVEVHGIDFIPEGERHGRARELFAVWAASNITYLYIVVGGAMILLGLNPWQAMAVVVAGNLFWALVGILAASGPSSGTPSSVVQRAMYGIRGNRVNVAIVGWGISVAYEAINLAIGSLAGFALVEQTGDDRQHAGQDRDRGGHRRRDADDQRLRPRDDRAAEHPVHRRPDGVRRGPRGVRGAARRLALRPVDRAARRRAVGDRAGRADHHRLRAAVVGRQRRLRPLPARSDLASGGRRLDGRRWLRPVGAARWPRRAGRHRGRHDRPADLAGRDPAGAGSTRSSCS